MNKKQIEFIEEIYKENNKLIEKFKRELTRSGVKSIREQATEMKHNIIYFSKKDSKNNFNTEKQRYNIFNGFFNVETNPNYKGHFNDEFDKINKNFTVKEIVKIYEMIDLEGKKRIKDHIKELERINFNNIENRHHYNFNMQSKLFLYFFYKTLVKIETEKKLIQYLETKEKA